MPAAPFHQRKVNERFATVRPRLVAGRFIRKGCSLSFVEGVCVVSGRVYTVYHIEHTAVNVHESRVKRVERRGTIRWNSGSLNASEWYARARTLALSHIAATGWFRCTAWLGARRYRSRAQPCYEVRTPNFWSERICSHQVFFTMEGNQHSLHFHIVFQTLLKVSHASKLRGIQLAERLAASSLLHGGPQLLLRTSCTGRRPSSTTPYLRCGAGRNVFKAELLERW